MDSVTIYGAPQSTYVRTARMACVEKGVAHEVVAQAPRSPEQLAVHPFGRIPAFRHGDLVLFETSAICRYVDHAFEGPALIPTDPLEAIRMEEWVSAYACYGRQDILGGIVAPRFGILEMTEEQIQAGVPELEATLAVFDRRLASSAFLAGDDLTIADLMLAPCIFWLEMTPEGQAALPKVPALRGWYAKIVERDSFKATIPPMPDQQAA